MVRELGAAGGLAVAAGFAAWAVRGRSAEVFAPSVWHGPRHRRELALTFDDGPSEGTPELLELLERLGLKATFFLCGIHVERLPETAAALVQAGHEAGNHTYSHPGLWLRRKAFLREEIGRAQEIISEATGERPGLFRAPYGVRWPGLGAVQREFGLTGVMWTVIGRDWTLGGHAVSSRLVRGAAPGGIFCLHDGRGLQTGPDIRSTIDAVRESVPRLLDAGYTFRTVSELIR